MPGEDVTASFICAIYHIGGELLYQVDTYGGCPISRKLKERNRDNFSFFFFVQRVQNSFTKSTGNMKTGKNEEKAIKDESRGM